MRACVRARGRACVRACECGEIAIDVTVQVVKLSGR